MPQHPNAAPITCSLSIFLVSASRLASGSAIAKDTASYSDTMDLKWGKQIASGQLNEVLMSAHRGQQRP